MYTFYEPFLYFLKIGNLQELMDVLPNIDVSDVMEIPKVFRCDEQTLPCDHTTKYRYCLYVLSFYWVYLYSLFQTNIKSCIFWKKFYRTLTGWCNNLNFPEYGKYPISEQDNVFTLSAICLLFL